jgi:hypothetical protein
VTRRGLLNTARISGTLGVRISGKPYVRISGTRKTDHLKQFESGTFDFIYSDIVLQHLPSTTACLFITEFLRLLKPGGVTVFQIPSERRLPAERSFSPVRMDARAYRAQLDVTNEVPPILAPGEHAVLLIELQNLSTHAWDQRVVGPIRLGNHWLSAAGDMLVQDDGRTLLAPVVPPSTAMRVPLQVSAPLGIGRYICELDLVHEGVTWFGDMGSRTVRQIIDVRAGDVHPQTSTAVDELGVDIALPETDLQLPPAESFELGEFPMDGVHRDDVLALISGAGGHLFHLESDERGGPEWYGYRYYVHR